MISLKKIPNKHACVGPTTSLLFADVGPTSFCSLALASPDIAHQAVRLYQDKSGKC